MPLSLHVHQWPVQRVPEAWFVAAIRPQESRKRKKRRLEELQRSVLYLTHVSPPGGQLHDL
jgi:hypothetical protein